MTLQIKVERERERESERERERERESKTKIYHRQLNWPHNKNRTNEIYLLTTSIDGIEECMIGYL